jgi:7-cyano-7-deazaguanine synthase
MVGLAALHTSPLDMVAVSFFYGQKHSVELIHAEKIVNYYQIPDHLSYTIPPAIFQDSESELVNPHLDINSQPYPKVGPVPTYVPFRNGIFLSIAAAIAISKNCSVIHYGAHATDAADYAYPDCTIDFVSKMRDAVMAGTYNKVELVAPLNHLTKTQIVELGSNLKVPFELTRSCYKSDSISCGECSTCQERLKAFKNNHFEDPIKYKTLGS